MRKPFFRKSTKCWYVKDSDGKFVRLDPDEETAFRLWNQILEVQRVGVSDDVSFSAIAEAWAQEHQNLLSAEKFRQAVTHLANFATSVDGKLAVDVSKNDLLTWMKLPKRGQKVWAVNTQRDAARAIKRVFQWAVDERKLSWNPLAGIRISEGKSRVTTISYEDHARLVIHCRAIKEARPFALYLIASRCGSRPKQIREVMAKHVLADGTAWLFEEHKTRTKTGRPLVVYLSPCLQTLTRILLANRSSGECLFLNANGEPWKKNTVVHRMKRLREKLGLPGDLVVYAYRHSFATGSLLAGNSLATVAALLGHSSTSMVSRVYGHLDQHKQHLLDAVRKTV